MAKDGLAGAAAAGGGGVVRAALAPAAAPATRSCTALATAVLNFPHVPSEAQQAELVAAATEALDRRCLFGECIRCHPPSPLI